MGARREQRARVSIPVRISGMDADGALFSVEAITTDITPVGARLEGVFKRLYRGSSVLVQCGNSKARFRVVWSGAIGGPDEGRVGLQLLDHGKYIWGKALDRKMGDDFQPESAETSEPAESD